LSFGLGALVLCASSGECNNKLHSPSHKASLLREVAASTSNRNTNRCHGWLFQKRSLGRWQTIAPITIRTCTRPSGVGRTFRAPQCFGVRHTMNSAKYFIIFAIPLMYAHAVVAESDELCPKLTDFLSSISVDQAASIELHTSWGSNFSGVDDDGEYVMAAKRCIHGDVPSAKKACEYLMSNTSPEFPGLNFKSFLLCLSPKTKIEKRVQFIHQAVSL